MWTALFWGGWGVLTVAVWRHEWRRPPEQIRAADDQRMIRHLHQNYPESGNTDQ